MVLLRYLDLSIKIQNGQRGRFILQSACMKMLGPWDTPSLSAQVQESYLCYLLPSAPSLANSSSLKRRERWQCCCALQYVAVRREKSRDHKLIKKHQRRRAVFTGGLVVKNPPAQQEMPVQSPGWQDPLEKGMAAHASILAWRIPELQEPGRLQSTGSRQTESLSLEFRIKASSFPLGFRLCHSCDNFNGLQCLKPKKDCWKLNILITNRSCATEHFYNCVTDKWECCCC